MMLKSQAFRSHSVRSTQGHSRRSKKLITRLVIVVILLTAGVLAIWTWWPGTQPPKEQVVAAATDAEAQSDTVAENVKSNDQDNPAENLQGESLPKISMGHPLPPAFQVGNYLKNPATIGQPDQELLAMAADEAESIEDAEVEAEREVKEDRDEEPEPSGKAEKKSTSSPQPKNRIVQRGLQLIAQGKLIEARRILSAVLLERADLTRNEAGIIRDELTQVNNRLVFSPEVASNDPFAFHYAIETGDALSKLPKKLGVKTDWRFIARLNGITNPNRIRVGQRLKIITGPFHAVVTKEEYRLDLFLGDENNHVFVRSFPVGLGEYGTTPEGLFEVKPNSKLVNPEWANPRTGERFAAKDPNNPIGEHWIGLVGESENIRGLEGYGLHGTIEPESIGQQMSMGCIRMLPDDIAVVYELMIEGISRVEIRGRDYP